MVVTGGEDCKYKVGGTDEIVSDWVRNLLPYFHAIPLPFKASSSTQPTFPLHFHQVWDSYGRLLFQSSPLDYAVTSVAWCPSGEMFAAGSFDSLQLCDRMGWAYSKVRGERLRDIKGQASLPLPLLSS